MLYFLSAREYQPLISSIEFDFATDRQTGIFALTLRKEVKNPFGIRDDEPGDNKSGDDKSGDDKEKSKTKGSSKTPVKIDFDGIEQRADGHRLAVLGRDLAKHAGRGRRHFDGDLVGFELDQRLVHRDGVAGLLEPAADGGFRHGLAERRNTNFSHGSFPQLLPRSPSAETRDPALRDVVI